MEEQTKLKEVFDMAEEAKQEGKNMLSMLFKLVLGLVFLALGILAVIVWFESLKTVFKGCVGLFLLLAGMITLAIAKE